MTISPEMQSKIEKINNLTYQGYTLSMRNGAVDLRNSSGKPVNIYWGPAGFSWIAFFFPFAVCSQIKEWSYFYVVGSILLLASLVQGTTGYEANYALGTVIGINYGFMFPYLRKIANDSGVEEIPKGKSIIVGLLLTIVCAIPSLLIDAMFGNF
tara:strand:- start:41 stop:502 length:462 start_codon:yes stop_codon:yes gene_type:complete